MIRYLTPAAALAAAASPALADAERYGHMMGWGYGTGMLFGPVLWILILGLVVAGIIWFVRQPGVSSTQRRPGHAGHAARQGRNRRRRVYRPQEAADRLARADI